MRSMKLFLLIILCKISLAADSAVDVFNDDVLVDRNTFGFQQDFKKRYGRKISRHEAMLRMAIAGSGFSIVDNRVVFEGNEVDLIANPSFNPTVYAAGKLFVDTERVFFADIPLAEIPFLVHRDMQSMDEISIKVCPFFVDSYSKGKIKRKVRFAFLTTPSANEPEGVPVAFGFDMENRFLGITTGHTVISGYAHFMPPAAGSREAIRLYPGRKIGSIEQD